MLQIKEVEVRGKRKAVIISTDIGDEDEIALLELIWSALGQYEERKKPTIKVRWTFAKANGKFSEISLVYPCLFIGSDLGIGDEETPRRLRKKKRIQKIAPQT